MGRAVMLLCAHDQALTSGSPSILQAAVPGSMAAVLCRALSGQEASTSAWTAQREQVSSLKHSQGKGLTTNSTSRRQCLEKMTAATALTLLYQFRSPKLAAALTIADVTPPIAPAEPLSAMEKAIISVFERTTYSVVNIFDNTIQGQSRVAQVDQPEGNGTGFIWDKEGHIITNFHVLGSALTQAARRPGNSNPKVARVTLLSTDGSSQTYDGYLVGADRSKDLAVLRINSPQDQLQPVSLGQSGNLRVGQQVLCIGNPFGFDHTLTTGVISGVGREIQSRAGVLIGGGIQTDAAINPGNSGGPLLDSAGRVIGVNTAIFTNTGTSAGVGFAIPVDAVSRAVPQLIEFGKVIRPSLRIQVAGDQVAASLRVGKGALVQSVDPNSNAAKAGLLGTRRTLAGIAAGDVITALDQRGVASAGDLLSALDERSIGERVTLEVRRDAASSNSGRAISLELTLQDEVK